MTSEKEILQEHLDVMVNCVKALTSCYSEWCEAKDISRDAQKVIELEKKGDRIHEKFTEYLFTGGAVHFSKADKLLMSERIDKILDVAEIAAQKLLIIPKGTKVKSSCTGDIKELSNVVINTCELLKEAIILVNSDFDKAKVMAQKVEDSRRKARELEWAVIKDILSGQVDGNALLQKELVELLAMVADKAEALADYVDVIAIKYKSLL